MGRRIAAAAVALAVTFGAITLVALEGKSVALLTTTSPSGQSHRTRVWFAEEDGSFWIESATGSRPFYLDLQARPTLTMEVMGPPWARDAKVIEGRAELVPEPGGHEHIRSLLREKYGWADAWVAMLQDTSGSRAVRVVVDERRSNELSAPPSRRREQENARPARRPLRVVAGNGNPPGNPMAADRSR